MENSMLKVGIIGCGRIADQHVVEIGKMQGAEIVGACDKEVLLAKQMAERFNIKKYYDDVEAFLQETRPDVVHLTSPPQTHLALGKLCLEAGCHVMFEKPFGLNTREVEDLIRMAEDRKLKITVDHNAQFSHASLDMRRLIGSGFLGGPPVHIESIWCYSYGDAGYAKALLGDKKHWVRHLPGKMLHNIISHGIAKIAEFMEGDSPCVFSWGFSSPILVEIGEKDIFDELRVLIRDGNRMTAYFTFSTQMSPVVHQFRVYGPQNSLVMDDLHQTVTPATGNYTSYLNHFIPPIVDARKQLRNSAKNIKRFLKREWYFEHGRKYLISSFYKAIMEGAPLPIPYREIILTSKIMDEIFDGLSNRS
jgi:predicted dehydrogenase